MATPRASRIASEELVTGSHDLLAQTVPYYRAESDDESFGPFVILEQLGEGGMATVHRAEMIGADGFRKDVALKRLHTDRTVSRESIEAFVHEAQLASRLHHPHIAQVYDLGKVEGTYYIAMELIIGPTLTKVIAQARDAAGSVPLPIALEILIQLCDALDHAHDLRDEHGAPLHLVHRDVSPSNVILSSEGNVKLIDFGIAKAKSSRATTADGVIKGKFGYLAPEYTYGRLDHRADLWGVGVIAYELLTGHRLFSGDSDFEVLEKVRTMQIPKPSYLRAGISPALDEIVLNVLERNPDERIQSAGALRAALASEAQRLGCVANSRKIRDWVIWAFAQEARATVDDSVAVPIDHTETFLLDWTETFMLQPAPAPSPPAPAPSAPAQKTEPGTSRRAVQPGTSRRAAQPSKPARSSSPREPSTQARPRWTPPTHWTHEPAKRSKLPFVLGGAVVATLVTALQLGWFG